MSKAFKIFIAVGVIGSIINILVSNWTALIWSIAATIWVYLTYRSEKSRDYLKKALRDRNEGKS